MTDVASPRATALRVVDGLDEDVAERLADHPLFAQLSDRDFGWLVAFDAEHDWALEEMLRFYDAARKEQGIDAPSPAEVAALMTASFVNLVLKDGDEALAPLVGDYVTLCLRLGVKELPYNSGSLA